jgi:Family of unknown function (DUF6516)
MPFLSRADYEALLYALPQQFPHAILVSTVRLYSTSALTARIVGSIHFVGGVELHVAEFIDFLAGQIRDYSYTVYRGVEKIRWYDPQPHPDTPELASTFPHHRHEPPEIKRNRRPAPGISFDAPNLPTVIADILQLLDED